MNQLPIIGVGAVVIHDDRVLLIKRAKPPFAGQWTIPGGKVGWGETLQAAAEREILEETGIHIKAKQAIYAFDLIQSPNEEAGYHYVVIDLEADYVSGEPVANDDAADVKWFSASEINEYEVQETTKQLLMQYWLKTSVGE